MSPVAVLGGSSGLLPAADRHLILPDWVHLPRAIRRARRGIVPDVRNADDLRRFVAQDWAAAERDKELYWRDWKKKHGPAAGIRIADELRKQALAQKPGWPSEQERAEDLASHLRALEAFDRISSHRRRAPR